MKKTLYWVLVGIFSLIFVISAYIVVDYLLISNQRRQDLENLYSDFTEPLGSSTTKPGVTTKPGTQAQITLPSGMTFPPIPTTVPTPTAPPDTLPSVPGTTPTWPSVPGTEPTFPSVPGIEPTFPSVPGTEPPAPSVPETEPTEPPVTEPPHIHSYVQTEIPPTCTQKGYSVFVCACGAGYADKEIPMADHSYSAWEYGTGSVATRNRSRSCTVCGEKQTQEILGQFSKYLKINTDVVGWIRIVLNENASAQYNKYLVNYPIMHRPADKDYYLYRDIYGKYEKGNGGSIYLREQCDILEPTDVMTIYGHAMSDGTMFGRLNRYITKSFFNAHPYIQFWDLYEQHTYQVVCIFKTSGTYGKGFPYHTFDNFASEAEYEEFINGVRDLAIHDSGIETHYGDKFICLSTCEYSQPNGRLVLVAKRIS